MEEKRSAKVTEWSKQSPFFIKKKVIEKTRSYSFSNQSKPPSLLQLKAFSKETSSTDYFQNKRSILQKKKLRLKFIRCNVT
ncbi:hypothetical protein [Niallia sp. MER TA 168]|uniref:Uncharacterized protein n=1 Tax=Niallia hominis TaxID=3133173 RepID=A0ABV1EW19_9BACI|nr:hypothetical protein [Niallia sp. MER TA 168]